MKRLLQYRAGPQALHLLKDRGLNPESVGTVVGPASGPRWLVLTGIDRALHDRDLILGSRRAGRRLLVGASAGAWRMLAFGAARPEAAYRDLLHGYIHQRFSRTSRPSEVSTAYRTMLRSIFDEPARERLLHHPQVNIAVHVVRARRGWPWKSVAAQKALLGASGLLHFFAGRGAGLWFERLLFHTRPSEFPQTFAGKVAPLTDANLVAAAQASGNVPFYMQPPADLPYAPAGYLFDGGLLDYHLRQRYNEDHSSITLFPHYQRDIHPVWFDRFPPRRRPKPEALDAVLQIYPSDEFIAGLPGGAVPDRADFLRWIDEPEQRIRRWLEVASQSEQLGEALQRDLDSGDWIDHIKPIR